MTVDRPVIVSGPMVLALLREASEQGTGKSMTRRLAWRLVDVWDNHTRHPSLWQRVKPGGRLWVKETHYRLGHWRRDGNTKSGNQRWRFRPAVAVKTKVRFDLDGVPPRMVGRKRNRTIIQWWKRPSIFMPRDLSRLTLVVTATKIEPLQSISEQDCEREGLVWARREQIWGVKVMDGYSPFGLTADECFMNLWCDLHGPSAWADNPEVVALAFTVHEQNIDAMKEAA